MSEEREHGPRLDEVDDEGTIRVSRADMLRLLAENKRLNEQIEEVHVANASLVEERRVLKKQITNLEKEIGASAERSAARVLREHDENNRAAMVREFLSRVTPWQETLDAPGIPSAGTLRFRVRLVLDEVAEFLDAVFDDRAAVDQLRAVFRWFLEQSQWKRDLFLSGKVFAEVIHEAVDVAYAIEGFLATLGVDGTAAFRIVHAANTAKEGGGRDDSGKLRKPAGWSPPDVEGELRRQSLLAGRKGPEDERSDAGRVEGRAGVENAAAAPSCERCGSTNTRPLPEDASVMLGLRFKCFECGLAFGLNENDDLVDARHNW